MAKLNGTVTLSLESYNEMFLKLSKYESAVKIKECYGENIEVVINMSVFETEIKEQFKTGGYNKGFTLKPVEYWYNSSYGLFEKIEKENEESK